MSGPTTEVRWLITDRAHDGLGVDVSVRRASSAYEEELIGSHVVGLDDLNQELSDYDYVRDLFARWLSNEPREWQADGPAVDWDPAEYWRDEEVAATWGMSLWHLIVARVVGNRLDSIIEKAANGSDAPTVRLLFALRGTVARRLPVELLLWPNVIAGPIAQQKGLSVLREAEPLKFPSLVEASDKPRIVAVGVAARGVADDDWQRMTQRIDQGETHDFRGRVGPDLTEIPEDALQGLRSRSGDLAVLWGHGTRQAKAQPIVWRADKGTATETDLASAFGDRYSAAILAMCYSGSEGWHGERSVVSGVVRGGVAFVVGFQGEPTTKAVADTVHKFILSLRHDHQPDIDAFDACELALYQVRTRSNDGHGSAQLIVAEVAPHLTAGRRRRSAPYGNPGAQDEHHFLQAYRTAGQLLITRIDGHGLVRIPLPVDPLEFKMQINDGVLRLDHAPLGLKLDLQKILELWDGLEFSAVDLAAAIRPDKAWGLKSAMLDAVVGEIERIAGERRPDAVDAWVCRARQRDSGTPPAWSVVQVETGAVICTLGPPPDQLRVDVAYRDPRAGAIDITQILGGLLDDGRSPVRDAAKADWENLDRAIGGDRQALERLVDDQLAVFRPWWARRPLSADLGPLPDQCLAFPTLTQLLPSEL